MPQEYREKAFFELKFEDGSKRTCYLGEEIELYTQEFPNHARARIVGIGTKMEEMKK